MTESPVVWRATKDQPCPICGGDHSCSRTADGLHFCRRTVASVPGWRHLGEGAHGFHLFREDGASFTPHEQPLPPKAQQPSSPKADVPPPDWGRLCRMMREWRADSHEQRLTEQAARLGVPAAALDAVGFGTLPVCKENPRTKEHPDPECWASPEKDGNGNVVGILRRLDEGKDKRRVKGSKNGLSYADDWMPTEGLLLVPEGPTDVATALAAGMHAVGRPSNMPGEKDSLWLANMIADLPEGVTPVVIGENDEKQNGKWPGKEGAVGTARRLTKLLGKPVLWCLPPEGVKDLRAWYVLLTAEGKDAKAAITDWLTANARSEQPPGTERPPDDEKDANGEPVRKPPPVTSGPAATEPAEVPQVVRLTLDVPPPASACPRACSQTGYCDETPDRLEGRRYACDGRKCPVCGPRLIYEDLLVAERAINAALAAGMVPAVADLEGVSNNAITQRIKSKESIRIRHATKIFVLYFRPAGARLATGFADVQPDAIAPAVREAELSMLADAGAFPFYDGRRYRPINLGTAWQALKKALRNGATPLTPKDSTKDRANGVAPGAGKPPRPKKHFRSLAASDLDEVIAVLVKYGLDPSVTRPAAADPGRLVWAFKVWLTPLSGPQRLAVMDELQALRFHPPEPGSGPES